MNHNESQSNGNPDHMESMSNYNTLPVWATGYVRLQGWTVPVVATREVQEKYKGIADYVPHASDVMKGYQDIMRHTRAAEKVELVEVEGQLQMKIHFRRSDLMQGANDELSQSANDDLRQRAGDDLRQTMDDFQQRTGICIQPVTFGDHQDINGPCVSEECDWGCVGTNMDMNDTGATGHEVLSCGDDSQSPRETLSVKTMQKGHYRRPEKLKQIDPNKSQSNGDPDNWESMKDCDRLADVATDFGRVQCWTVPVVATREVQEKYGGISDYVRHACDAIKRYRDVTGHARVARKVELIDIGGRLLIRIHFRSNDFRQRTIDDLRQRTNDDLRQRAQNDLRQRVNEDLRQRPNDNLRQSTTDGFMQRANDVICIQPVSDGDHQADNKPCSYEEYDRAPGGTTMDMMDTGATGQELRSCGYDNGVYRGSCPSPTLPCTKMSSTSDVGLHITGQHEDIVSQPVGALVHMQEVYLKSGLEVVTVRKEAILPHHDDIVKPDGINTTVAGDEDNVHDAVEIITPKNEFGDVRELGIHDKGGEASTDVTNIMEHDEGCGVQTDMGNITRNGGGSDVAIDVENIKRHAEDGGEQTDIDIILGYDEECDAQIDIESIMRYDVEGDAQTGVENIMRYDEEGDAQTDIENIMRYDEERDAGVENIMGCGDGGAVQTYTGNVIKYDDQGGAQTGFKNMGYGEGYAVRTNVEHIMGHDAQEEMETIADYRSGEQHDSGENLIRHSVTQSTPASKHGLWEDHVYCKRHTIDIIHPNAVQVVTKQESGSESGPVSKPVCLGSKAQMLPRADKYYSMDGEHDKSQSRVKTIMHGTRKDDFQSMGHSKSLAMECGSGDMEDVACSIPLDMECWNDAMETGDDHIGQGDRKSGDCGSQTEDDCTPSDMEAGNSLGLSGDDGCSVISNQGGNYACDISLTGGHPRKPPGVINKGQNERSTGNRHVVVIRKLMENCDDSNSEQISSGRQMTYTWITTTLPAEIWKDHSYCWRPENSVSQSKINPAIVQPRLEATCSARQLVNDGGLETLAVGFRCREPIANICEQQCDSGHDGISLQSSDVNHEHQAADIDAIYKSVNQDTNDDIKRSVNRRTDADLLHNSGNQGSDDDVIRNVQDILSKYYRRQSKYGLFECLICSKTMRYCAGIRGHVQMHTGKCYKCPDCHRSFACHLYFKQHKKRHKNTVHKCMKCDARFAYRSDKVNHQWEVHQLGSFPCKYCDKTFRGSRLLQEHTVKHTGEKAFQCHICGMTMPTSHRLRQHLLHHSTPVQCHICDKRFPMKYALRKHIRNRHENNPPHLCEKCGNRFATTRNLTRHLRVIHGE